MADCDQVIAFWKEQEGVGLSEADKPDRIATYLNRNPGMSSIVRDGTDLYQGRACVRSGKARRGSRPVQIDFSPPIGPGRGL